MPSYAIGRITSSAIIPAYALINLVAPALTMDEWQAFCRTAIRRGVPGVEEEDVIVATNLRGHVQGLCIAAIRSQIAYGRIFDVSVFIVASAADHAGVAADMLQDLKAQALAENCTGIRIPDPGRRDHQMGEFARVENGSLWMRKLS